MIKIEAVTLEAAYKDAASQLECSVTELTIEVVQIPSKGFLGLFKKPAIIVALKEVKSQITGESNKDSAEDKSLALQQKTLKTEEEVKLDTSKESNKAAVQNKREVLKENKTEPKQKKQPKKQKNKQHEEKIESPSMINDTIMPASFVSMQEEDEEEYEVSNYLADYDETEEDLRTTSEIAETVKKEINELFELTCFKIEAIDVSPYDENTLLVEFKGEDAALLIGKEGYRYKALSYMIFNWLNTKYQVQLRLEIAEFLKNQEESISKYLVGICESIDRDGRAQTKILDGVLVQIALNELRDKYPDKYVVIRSTRDGLKYIIINDYHSN